MGSTFSMELGSEEDSEYVSGHTLGCRARRHLQGRELVTKTLQRTSLVGTNDVYTGPHDEDHFIAMALATLCFRP